jgi:hypothetical protein
VSPVASPELTLAERLAEAERSEEAPRRKAMDLSARHTTAVAAADYAEAARLQPLMNAAREQLAIAEGTTRGLREGLALTQEQQAAEQRVLQQAQDAAEARRVIENAMAAERRALDSIEESLAQFWATLGAAQDAYRQALAWETAAWQERERAYRAHVVLGERPDGMKITAPNRASVLLETDQMVRTLMQWSR